MKILILVAIAFSLSFTKLPITNLVNTKWTFIKINDKKNNTTLLADSSCKTSLDFGSNGQYGGFSGWNNFNGNYLVKKNHIQLNAPVGTKMAGPSKCKLGESLYLHYQNAKTYLLKVDTLKIFSLDSIELVFVKQP